MPNTVQFWTDDKIWAGILTDMGYAVADATHGADFIWMPPSGPLTPMELRGEVLGQIDAARIADMRAIFGERANTVGGVQEKIALMLYRRGGLTIRQINEFLGYSAETKTHTADTAIYQLRRTFGNQFIMCNNGIYSLGKL